MKKSYKYGIELETIVNDNKISYFREKSRAYGFEIDGDSSISTQNSNYSGVEFRTARPMRFTELERSVRKFSRMATELDAENEAYIKVNRTCGYHLHISDARFQNPKVLKRIVFLWTAIEDFLFTTQPQSRHSNKYCRRRLGQLFDQPEKLSKNKTQAISELTGSTRYYSLNLYALQRHGTIEVRLHSGTVNADKIIAWVRLISAIYDYCIDNYKHEEVVNLFKMSISDAKIQAIMSTLNIPDDLKAVYLARIERVSFTRLAEQQQSAAKMLELRPIHEKAKKRYEAEQARYQDTQQLYRSLRSSLPQQDY